MTDFIYYIYDITGVAGLIHTQGSTSTIYFYIKNALGDVVAITNSYGSIKAEYVYDAWGNILSVKSGTGFAVLPTDTAHVANINPFRYRSYYYDTETGFYYLQTRYYDPEIRRFINKDSISLLPELAEVVGQLNLYAYCGNNPIAYTDESGESIFGDILGWIATVMIVVGAIAMIGLVAVGTVATGGLLATVLVGAGVGIIAGVGGGIAIQGGLTNANPWSLFASGLIGGAIGAISGAVSFGFAQIGQAVGQQLGFALSNLTHLSSGVNIAKFFGLSASILGNAGFFVGGIAGGAAGGMATNFMANEIVESCFGSNYRVNNPNWARSGLLQLFKWLWAI